MIELNYYEDEVFDSLENLNTVSTEFISCQFNSLNLSDFSLEKSKFIECNFSKCNFSNASFNYSTLRDVYFSQCKLVGINWSQTNSLNMLSFEECILNLSVFQQLNLKSLKAISSTLHEVDFSGSHMQQANFYQSDLEGAIFNECDLRQSDFRMAKNYSISPENSKVQGARFSMPQAMALLNSLGVIIE